MSSAAGKPKDPLLEALANAPVDELPETNDERTAIAKPNPEWVDGAKVTAMIAERLRQG